MGDELKIQTSALAEFVCDGNEALQFRLVKSPEDLEDPDTRFKPEMCHQIYGDNENIFGFKGLAVNLFMTARSLQTYLGHTYKEKVDPSKTDGVTADDVISHLVKLLAPGSFTDSKETFLSQLNSDQEQNFRPMGELVDTISMGGKTYEVFRCLESTPRFRDYHERLQAWIMFYIDAASFIDIDDDNWRIFLMFEKTGGPGSERYAVVGYITVYQYYAYGRETNRTRPRISQMLVLPPYQRRGLGSQLLETVYRNYTGDDKVIDITVEDPSDNFVRLRDFVDTKNCLKLPAYSKSEVLKGFSEDITSAAAKDLKICKKQARRIYEIIRLHYTSLADQEQYRSYKMDVKRRLNIPYRKEQSQLSKLQKLLKPQEFAAAMVNITNKEQRLEILEKQFTELETHYKSVLEKVAAA